MTTRARSSFAIAAAALMLTAAPLGGCSMFGGGEAEALDLQTPEGLLGNPYFWRAALETLAFMPITRQDPAAGFIETGWYQANENPNEQVRVTVQLIDAEFRTESLLVTVYRQVNQGGGWIEAGVKPSTAGEVQSAIILRARQLRVQAGEDPG